MHKTISIGNDAEFILIKGKTPISSIGLIGGTKDNPLPVNLGALQEDNVLAEINIKPAFSAQEWEHHIKEVVKQLEYKLPKGVKISKLASAIFPDKALEHPKALRFGCDPDYNAWTGSENPCPCLPKGMERLRSAGGHVHVGIKGLSRDAKMALIRTMDALIGIQTVLLDKDKRRKNLYGKAGAMRLKPYGVEWRTPSNFWIFDEYTRCWMFNSAIFCASSFTDQKIKQVIQQDVVDIINENDQKAARIYTKLIGRRTGMPVHKRLCA